eukprot:gene37750-18596_t
MAQLHPPPPIVCPPPSSGNSAPSVRGELVMRQLAV